VYIQYRSKTNYAYQKNLPALSSFTCCFWLSKGHLPITAGGRWLFTIATSCEWL